MVNKLKNQALRKISASISLTEDMWFDFKDVCYAKNTTPAREIREFVMKFLEKNK